MKKILLPLGIFSLLSLPFNAGWFIVENSNLFSTDRPLVESEEQKQFRNFLNSDLNTLFKNINNKGLYQVSTWVGYNHSSDGWSNFYTRSFKDTSVKDFILEIDKAKLHDKFINQEIVQEYVDTKKEFLMWIYQLDNRFEKIINQEIRIKDGMFYNFEFIGNNEQQKYLNQLQNLKVEIDYDLKNQEIKSATFVIDELIDVTKY